MQTLNVFYRIAVNLKLVYFVGSDSFEQNVLIQNVSRRSAGCPSCIQQHLMRSTCIPLLRPVSGRKNPFYEYNDSS